jgi:O-antigen/teichoic acid export membrane protein
MGVSEFGAYSYAAGWLAIMALVANVGFPSTVLRFIPEYRIGSDPARVLGIIKVSRRASLATGGCFALIGTFLVLARTGGAPDTGATALIIAFWVVPLQALVTVNAAISRAIGKVVIAYLPALVMIPLTTVIGAGIAVTVTGQLLSSQAMAITLVSVVIAISVQTGLHALTLPERRVGVAARFDTRAWLKISAPLLLVATFQVVLSQADLITLGTIKGVESAGIYLAASKSAAFVSYVAVSLNAIAAPLFAELYAKGDLDGLKVLTGRVTALTFWPTLVLSIILAGAASQVLGLFGANFVAGASALRLLLLGQVISAGCGSVGYLLIMTGYHFRAAKVYGWSALGNVVLCYVGARTLGLTGASLSTSFSMVLANILLLIMARRTIGIDAAITATTRASSPKEWLVSLRSWIRR